MNLIIKARFLHLQRAHRVCSTENPTSATFTWSKTFEPPFFLAYPATETNNTVEFAAIQTYVNGTFYPVEVSDITIGTTATAREVYNPLCGCCNPYM